MKRITFRLPENQSESIDKLIDEEIFPNRSEYFRSLIREDLQERTLPDDDRREEMDVERVHDYDKTSTGVGDSVAKARRSISQEEDND